MKIDVIKRDDGSFLLLFEDEEISLSEPDLKALLLQITQTLAPSPEDARRAQAQSRRLLNRVKTAKDIDVQVFILAADHDDMVVLMKAAESHQDVREKLFKNMSDKSRKMFLEDVAFRFKRDVPDAQVNAALGRLLRTAEELRADGRTDL